MGAINPARPFHDRTGQHSRLAQHFQRHASPNDIDDRIHRADFVEMHLLWWQPMNFSFRDGDATENGDGFLLHPFR